MKTQRAVLPLAFLSAAFMLACQDQGLAPVGLDGVGVLLDAAGPHPHVDVTFDVSFTGDVAGDGVLRNKNGLNGLQQEHGAPVTINLTGFRTLITKGTDCFSTDDISSSMQVGQVTPSNIDDAIIRFFFDALGTNGSPVKYGLAVRGPFDTPGDWPPAVSTTITGQTFVLAHSNGPGNKVACTGEGGLTFDLTVTRA